MTRSSLHDPIVDPLDATLRAFHFQPYPGFTAVMMQLRDESTSKELF